MIFYILYIIIIFYKLDIDKMNIKTTFLYKIINQLLFIKMSKDYYNKYKNIIYRLKKDFYNFK